MKAIIAAGTAIIVIGLGSYFILNALEFSSQTAFTGHSVRLD